MRQKQFIRLLLLLLIAISISALPYKHYTQSFELEEFDSSMTKITERINTYPPLTTAELNLNQRGLENCQTFASYQLLTHHLKKKKILAPNEELSLLKMFALLATKNNSFVRHGTNSLLWMDFYEKTLINSFYPLDNSIILQSDQVLPSPLRVLNDYERYYPLLKFAIHFHTDTAININNRDSFADAFFNLLIRKGVYKKEKYPDIFDLYLNFSNAPVRDVQEVSLLQYHANDLDSFLKETFAFSPSTATASKTVRIPYFKVHFYLSPTDADTSKSTRNKELLPLIKNLLTQNFRLLILANTQKEASEEPSLHALVIDAYVKIKMENGETRNYLHIVNSWGGLYQGFVPAFPLLNDINQLYYFNEDPEHLSFSPFANEQEAKELKDTMESKIASVLLHSQLYVSYHDQLDRLYFSTKKEKRSKFITIFERKKQRILYLNRAGFIIDDIGNAYSWIDLTQYSVKSAD